MFLNIQFFFCQPLRILSIPPRQFMKLQNHAPTYLLLHDLPILEGVGLQPLVGIDELLPTLHCLTRFVYSEVSPIQLDLHLLYHPRGCLHQLTLGLSDVLLGCHPRESYGYYQANLMISPGQINSTYKKLVEGLSGHPNIPQAETGDGNKLGSYVTKELFQETFSEPLLTVLKDFQNSQVIPLNQLGKRSKEIYFSKSMKYVLKKVPREDIQKLGRMIESYSHYLARRPNSSICRIQKVLALQTRSQKFLEEYFVIMQNLRSDAQGRSYDLKGFQEGRQIKGYSSHLGKDYQFANSNDVESLAKGLTCQQKTNLIATIQSDIEFLEGQNIMDYSILLTFSQINPGRNYLELGEQFVTFGVIDYLQEFTPLKKLQSRLKSIFKTQISAVGSKQYGLRLLNFLKNSLECGDQ